MSIRSHYQTHIDVITESIPSEYNPSIDEFVDLLLNCKGKIYFTGVGKNGHVAAKATSTFSSIGVSCFFIDPVDSVHGDMGVINEEDIFCLLYTSPSPRDVEESRLPG